MRACTAHVASFDFALISLTGSVTRKEFSAQCLCWCRRHSPRRPSQRAAAGARTARLSWCDQALDTCADTKLKSSASSCAAARDGDVVALDVEETGAGAVSRGEQARERGEEEPSGETPSAAFGDPGAAIGEPGRPADAEAFSIAANLEEGAGCFDGATSGEAEEEPSHAPGNLSDCKAASSPRFGSCAIRALSLLCAVVRRPTNSRCKMSKASVSPIGACFAL
mmetsp:Transcript_51675/g.167857  ORF Transcript_51675/g.167857 Transcript_51675/m.167857 type:complete len:224 (-) Transcript_51675:1499-2170(-)